MLGLAVARALGLAVGNDGCSSVAGVATAARATEQPRNLRRDIPLRPLAKAIVEPDPLLGHVADLLFDELRHLRGELDRIAGCLERFMKSDQMPAIRLAFHEACDHERPRADRGLSEKRNLRTLRADVLIDEEGEDAAAPHRLDHLSRRARGSAIDRMHAGACAEIADVAIDVGLVALALQHADGQTFRGHSDSVRQTLPVAAMRREDDDAASFPHLFESLVEADVVNMLTEILAVDVRHPENLEHRLAEMMKRCADRVAPAFERPVGESDSDVFDAS